MKKTHCGLYLRYVFLLPLLFMPLSSADVLSILSPDSSFEENHDLLTWDPLIASEVGIESQINPHFSIETHSKGEGIQVQRIEINSPPYPPIGREEKVLTSDQVPASAYLLPNFPSYNWVFGCSAVAGAMIAAYYDVNGYPDIYTGPTNGGNMPISDTGWGTWTDGVGYTYPSNPLVASQDSVDGYSGKGSIEDYWVRYGSVADDPFINEWPEHTWGTAIGDFMRTSQSLADNVDGATSFYYFFSSDPFTCKEMALIKYNVAHLDGTYGRKNFYEARGYTVNDDDDDNDDACYNQITENQVSGGFSLADFQAEIDAGRPVLLNLYTYNYGGHSVVGYGYYGETIFIRDTWDSDPESLHTMTWGESYQGYELYAVSVVNLLSTTPGDFGKINPEDTAADVPLETTLSWGSSSWAESYQYCLDTTDDVVCSTSWVDVGKETTAALSGLERETDYTWQVRAVNSKGNTYADGDEDAYWHFSTVPNPPSAFGKVEPGDGAQDLPTTPELSWESSDGAVSYEYCYDTVDDGDCSDWQDSGTSTSVQLTGLVEGETYFWQARARNSGGVTYADGSVDGYWDFTTKLNPPGSFNKISPNDYDVDVLVTPILTWEESPGADYYQYCIDITGSCDEWIHNGQETTIYVSGLEISTDYIWQVRAVNDAGITFADGEESAVWHFTTTHIPQPSEFEKTSPDDGTADLFIPVTLSWTASDGVESYEYCFNTTKYCQDWYSAEGSTSVILIDLKPKTAYFWQVRALNNGGTTYAGDDPGNYWQFKTAPEPPGVFKKISPHDGENNLPLNPILSWESSSDATTYEYCINSIDDNLCSEWIPNNTVTMVQLSRLEQGTDYLWQVRAKNISGTTYADGSNISFWVFKTSQMIYLPVIICSD